MTSHFDFGRFCMVSGEGLHVVCIHDMVVVKMLFCHNFTNLRTTLMFVFMLGLRTVGREIDSS